MAALCGMISLEFLLYCPQFWQTALNSGKVTKPLKMVNFDGQKKNVGPEKKAFPRIHIDMCFLQKTGSKLVKFGLCDPISILHPAIGCRHPVPCLNTQITERQGTAMY